MTDPVSDEYLELVVDIHGRQFQRYSIENGIYHIPVDEVSHHLVLVPGSSQVASSKYDSPQLHTN